MTTKHENMEQVHSISIPGLPEGWKAVAYRIPRDGIDYILFRGKVCLCDFVPAVEYLIVEKIQPRRIVLEETEEFRHAKLNDWVERENGKVSQWLSKYPSGEPYKIWRLVVEEESALAAQR